MATVRDISERKEAEELFRTMSDSSPIGIYIVQDGKFQFVNPQFEKLTGYRKEELLGEDALMVVFQDDRDMVIQNAFKILQGRRSFPCEFRCVTKKGELRWVLETYTPIWYKGKRAVLGNYIDITEYKRVEEELRASNQRLHDMIEFLPDATFVIDREKKVIAWNRAIEEMTGVLKEDILGRGDYAYAVPFYGTQRPVLVDLIFNSDRETEMRYEYVKATGTTLFAEVYIPSLFEGKGAFLWVKASPLYDSSGNFIGAIESMRDVTERKRTEEQLKYLSLHDPLTGLYNRTYFEEEMNRIGDGRCDPVGIIVCDVDGLKFVNDTLGHDVGDSLLVAAAGVIEESFRESDMVARIGGDEFAILLPNSSEKALEMASDRIRENVEWYNGANPELSLSISIGFAVRYDKSKTMADLFKEADNSMYREKLHRSQSVRSALVQTLMKALGARDFLTEGHADRLQSLVTGLARLMALPESKIADLRLLAQFHDIGKVGIPDSILFKPGPLTEEEFKEMRRHCEIGYRIAQTANDLLPIADWIIKHHEWWNGKGYPLGLKEEEIPLECRILAIADAYDAMTSDRPYRKALSHEDAVDELKRCTGSQFDPSLVPKFIELLAGDHEMLKDL